MIHGTDQLSFNGGGVSPDGLLLTSADKGTLKLWTIR
jgi:hypothetical protein